MRWFLIGALAAAVSACATANKPEHDLARPATESPSGSSRATVDGAAHSPTPGPSAAPSASPVGSEDGGGIGPDDRAAAAVVRAVAADLGVDETSVRVISVEAVVWPDSSLGCPEPGQMYLQVLTPGYRVVLEVDGRQEVAHTDRADPPHVARCASPRPPLADTTK